MVLAQICASAGGHIEHMGIKWIDANTLTEQTDITLDQSFFAVFCIEALSDALHTTGDDIYNMLTTKSDLLDSYIIPCYYALHTQGKDYIVRELLDIMKARGVLQ